MTVRGIELPINILVIVAVAIIVLLGVIALFYSTWFKSTTPVALDAAKAQACNSVANAGCSVNTATILLNPAYIGVTATSANLQALCENEYSITAGEKKTCLTRVCGMNCGTG